MEKPESERINFKPNVESLKIPKNLETDIQQIDMTVELIIIPE